MEGGNAISDKFIGFKIAQYTTLNYGFSNLNRLLKLGKHDFYLDGQSEIPKSPLK